MSAEPAKPAEPGWQRSQSGPRVTVPLHIGDVTMTNVLQ
jgi:hypothetical protein